mmetsp:Transcript_68442/g.193047  ORF Transcript_68442/g.193047 Transcript_68442/m.193047 type:complete len:298 (-) Transcript_68442:300-1193(-)
MVPLRRDDNLLAESFDVLDLEDTPYVRRENEHYHERVETARFEGHGQLDVQLALLGAVRCICTQRAHLAAILGLAGDPALRADGTPGAPLRRPLPDRAPCALLAVPLKCAPGTDLAPLGAGRSYRARVTTLAVGAGGVRDPAHGAPPALAGPRDRVGRRRAGPAAVHLVPGVRPRATGDACGMAGVGLVAGEAALAHRHARVGHRAVGAGDALDPARLGVPAVRALLAARLVGHGRLPRRALLALRAHDRVRPVRAELAHGPPLQGAHTWGALAALAALQVRGRAERARLAPRGPFG